MKFQFANRASSHLAASFPPEADHFTVAAGQCDRFPGVGTDQPAQLTLVAVDGTSEIVQCFNRSGDVFQVRRGQENTAVSAFDIGSLVELRLTAAVLNSFLPVAGGVLQGPLELAGNYIVNANLSGAPYIDYVKTNGTYPPDGNFAGAVEHLNGGIWPRHLGSTLLSAAMLPGAVFPWWGRLDQLPSWLKLCDGTLGTPDLRGRFVFGAYNDSEIGTAGGQFHSGTYPAGAHAHGYATGVAPLGAFNLPPVSLVLNTEKIGILSSAFDPAGQPRYSFISKLTGSVAYAGNQPTHGHPITVEGDHAHEFDAVPPFFRLYFVMFRSFNFN